MDFAWLIFAPEVAIYVRTLTFCLVLLMLVLWADRVKWIATETIINVVRSLAIIIAPSILLKVLVTDKLDDGTLFLARLLGFTMLCGSLFILVTRNTRDGTVHVAILISRIFTESAVLLTLVYTYYTNVGKKSPGFTDEFVWLAMTSTGMLLLGNVCFAVRGTDYSMYPQHTIRLNHHLRADALILLISALAFYGYPDLVATYVLPGTKSIGPFQAHLIRGLAAWNIGSSVISLQASGFLHERDKRAVFLTRLIECSVLLMAHLFNLMWLRQQTAINDIAIPLAYFMPLLLNALFGFFADGNVIYHVDNSNNRDSKFYKSH